MNYFLRFSFFSLLALSLSTGHLTYAASVGDIATFNIDKNFDPQGRSQLQAQLLKVSDTLYIYADKEWLDNQSDGIQSQFSNTLNFLSTEFNDNIYPQLTSLFGSEPNPGIDKDDKITILVAPMNSAESGYFREADEYDKLQVSYSNQREMLYISTDVINDFNKAKVVLAHEFTHLITFKQKNINFNISEETWLNEARADYSSRVMGYDNQYEGSNLQHRVFDFLSNPNDSISEWKGAKYDYAAVRLFTEYLVEHYGINVLVDSLHSQHIGIASINYALKQSDSKEQFSDVFTNWVIASVLNDCSLKEEYCYTDPNLKNFRLLPSINFLPFTGDASLSVNNFTKNWSGNWIKFIGGQGDLHLNFSTTKGLNFVVPYIANNGQSSVNFMLVGKGGKGDLALPNFGKDYKSLIIMPILMSNDYQADYLEPIYPYTLSVAMQGTNTNNNQQDLIQQLLQKIADLKAEIARLQNQRGSQTCRINKDLYLGIRNDAEVKCLQQFLASQGSDIYPEGIISGNFLDLTRKAVVRFQEKYENDILVPAGFSQGTGYAGPKTRAKINQIMDK